MNRHCVLLGTVAAGLLAAHVCQAQSWPARPLRLLVGFPPGGPTDVVGRLVAERLTDQLRQQVVIDNRPGAAGNIAAEMVAKANPDGYTLLFSSSAIALSPGMYSKLGYDPVKDLAPITEIGSGMLVLAVHPSLPVKTVREFVELAKKNPGKLNYGSVGIGSVFHLAAELFNAMAGTDTVHIPYKGSTDAITDMIGGRLNFMFMTLTGASAHIRSNRIRAIAICSKDRSPQMPELPPVSQVLPGYDVTSFAGIGATGGSPRPVIAKLNRELRAVMAGSDVIKQFTEAGGDMQPGSPEEMTRHVAEEIAKWRRVVQERKIEVK